MNSEQSLSEVSKLIKSVISDAGAVACGIACATQVPDSDRQVYCKWLSDSRHAGMSYMERNLEVRFDPRGLLADAHTIVATAFNYRQPLASTLIAEYAMGRDYHYVIGMRLRRAAEEICRIFGGEARVVTDSAPMRERWWAQHAGIGFRGDNGLLIVPGYGSAVLLGFILWTGEAQPDNPMQRECLHCGACHRACPGKALSSDGLVDARRCLSYLTIEHRGDFPPSMPPLKLIFGCDCCRNACPLDHGPTTEIAEFAADPLIAALTLESMATMGRGEFRRTFAQSPLMRLRLQGLHRNRAAFSSSLSGTSRVH